MERGGGFEDGWWVGGGGNEVECRRVLEIVVVMAGGVEMCKAWVKVYFLMF